MTVAQSISSHQFTGDREMPDPFKTQFALVKIENRERVARAADTLQAVMDDLDSIGPMIACAHLSLAIETLKAMLAEKVPNEPTGTR